MEGASTLPLLKGPARGGNISIPRVEKAIGLDKYSGGRTNGSPISETQSPRILIFLLPKISPFPPFFNRSRRTHVQRIPFRACLLIIVRFINYRSLCKLGRNKKRSGKSVDSISKALYIIIIGLEFFFILLANRKRRLKHWRKQFFQSEFIITFTLNWKRQRRNVKTL